ncbi:hypothetical protein DOTSEDRAFT_22624 [Dothistroma septosporum NZE10]|uniref:SnoaL-like domain-containing protein n=1 Tax=Dothistroma septosporum (strain NZE10 / CBS 128990) TaxID=675120 RepID=N1PT67_DOTSN|nr:hypothetical protein DOTSEDRAFT_22624 [Dothistroma septosporum NZE10]
MSQPLPNRSEIETLFKSMETGDYPAVFKRVPPEVDWTVMGTHPCAGRLSDFQEQTFARLGKIMKEPGIRLVVRNVIGGGDQPWATVELIADAECLSVREHILVVYAVRRSWYHCRGKGILG